MQINFCFSYNLYGCQYVNSSGFPIKYYGHTLQRKSIPAHQESQKQHLKFVAYRFHQLIKLIKNYDVNLLKQIPYTFVHKSSWKSTWVKTEPQYLFNAKLPPDICWNQRKILFYDSNHTKKVFSLLTKTLGIMFKLFKYICNPIYTS